jgi:hypothetical protein
MDLAMAGTAESDEVGRIMVRLAPVNVMDAKIFLAACSCAAELTAQSISLSDLCPKRAGESGTIRNPLSRPLLCEALALTRAVVVGVLGNLRRLALDLFSTRVAVGDPGSGAAVESDLPFGLPDAAALRTTQVVSGSGRKARFDQFRLAADGARDFNAPLPEEIMALRRAELVFVHRNLARVAVSLPVDRLAAVGA